MSGSETSRFPWLFAIPLYLIAFGGQFFFLNAYFWDDWETNFLKTAEETKTYWSEVGYSPFFGILQADILNNWPPAFRLLQLVVYALGSYFVYLILKSLKLPQWFTTVTCIVYLILPINSARVAISMINYAVSLCLFLAAWALLVSRRHLLFVPIAVILFITSFSTLSLIPLFVLPIAQCVFLDIRTGHSRRRIAVANGILLLLAPAYWFFIRDLHPPQGDDLVAYFTPSISGIIKASVLLSITLIVLLLVLIRHRLLATEYFRFLWLSIGLVAVALGASAYVSSGRLVDLTEWMLNFVPEASAWDSRHQLLLGIGFALIVAAAIGKPNSRMKIAGLVVVVMASVALNLTFMSSYMLDSRKQDALVEQFAEHPALLSARQVFVNDQATIFNARGRAYRHYELRGMTSKAFGVDPETVQDLDFVLALDCRQGLQADIEILIRTESGRLRALITRNPGITIEITRNPCLSN